VAGGPYGEFCTGKLGDDGIHLTPKGGTCEEASCPLAGGSTGLRLAFALEIERHCGADEILQGRLIDLVADGCRWRA
jgi:hypothetical protein